MLAKVCPRCGAQYENLKSTTCPQCFAKLLVVDEATAEELSAARAAVEQTPEFQQAKVEDDEKFREQSFGACFGVVLISLLTVITIGVLIFVAVRRQSRPAPRPPAAVGTPAAPVNSSDIITPLPVAAASPDDLLPVHVSPFTRVEIDQAVTLPGTLTRVHHAAYVPDSQTATHALEAQTLDVYVLSTGRPTPEQSAFLAGVALAAQRGPDAGGHPRLVFATEHWRYAAIGPAGGGLTVPTQFRDALATRFKGQ